MEKSDRKEIKKLGKKGFIKEEKKDIKEAKGYPAPKNNGK